MRSSLRNIFQHCRVAATSCLDGSASCSTSNHQISAVMLCAQTSFRVRTSTGLMPMALRGFSAQPSSNETVAKRSGGWGQAPPISLKTLLVAMMAGAGILAGTNSYKESKMQKVMQNSQQVAGKASVGGPFELIDHNGKLFTDKMLLGEFALLYFGFTFCPDICPEELEKIAAAIDRVEKMTGVKVQPVFISVDPDRDTPKKIKEYIAEFHPRLLGLTGDIESVKRVSKQYRVYFSKTGDSKTDYLVDHSIIHYLINPAGEFVTFYSKSYTAEALAESMADNVVEWKASHPSQYHPGQEITKKKIENAQQ